MRHRREVVAPREIRVGPRSHDVLGKAACLEDAVRGAGIAERRVPAAREHAELGERGGETAGGGLSPAVGVLVAHAHVIVPAAQPVGRIELGLVAAVAAPRDFDLAGARGCAAAGHQIHRSAE